MDDFDDDFDDFDNGDFDDFDGDDFEDDFGPEDSCDDGLNAEMQEDLEHEDNGIDIGWEEIAVIGGMVEEFAEEEKERRRIQRDMERKDGENSVI